MSLRLGRFFGIEVVIHWTFPLLLLYAVFVALSQEGGTWMDALSLCIFVLAVFFCVILHEFGHALTARMYGVRTRDITLLPIGGVARLERMPEKPVQELVVALAGPAVNVVIAGLLIPALILLGAGMDTENMGLATGDFFLRLALVNIFLVVFNMLPAFPMDGGRVFRALLSMKLPRSKATLIAARLGQGIAVLFFILGLVVSPILLLIAVFVFFGGMAETRAVAVREAFAGLPVRAAMMTDFHVLRPDTTLRQAADELLAGSQHEFPVHDDDGRVVALLTRDALMSGISEHGEDAPVSTVATSITFILRADDSLNDAMERLQSSGVSAAPVADDRGNLVGLLTLENAQELSALRQINPRRSA